MYLSDMSLEDLRRLEKEIQTAIEIRLERDRITRLKEWEELDHNLDI